MSELYASPVQTPNLEQPLSPRLPAAVAPPLQTNVPSSLVTIKFEVCVCATIFSSQQMPQLLVPYSLGMVYFSQTSLHTVGYNLHLVVLFLI